MRKKAKAEDRLPLGFICTCGERHKFPPYVYAHYRELMRFQCEKCKTAWDICLGMVSKNKGVDRAQPFYKESIRPTCGQQVPEKQEKSA